MNSSCFKLDRVSLSLTILLKFHNNRKRNRLRDNNTLFQVIKKRSLSHLLLKREEEAGLH